MEILISVAVTFLVTLILAWILFSSNAESKRLAYERERLTILRESVRDQSESERILEAIDLGVLYYDARGNLSISNQAAADFLHSIPKTFHLFLEEYGEANGMAAQLALGKEYASAVLNVSGMMIYISVQPVGAAPDRGNVVLIRDATRQFKEEQQRKEYVSNVSHELRTPLTTIKSYSESLMDWGVMEKQRPQILKDVSKIFEESTHMEQLIEDLNLLSSLDESSIGRYMHIEVVDLTATVKNLVERMQTQAQARNIDMKAISISQVPNIYCDRGYLERIVANLITNAIKYSDEGGHIDVYIGSVRDEVYVKVKDDGIGIDEKDQKLVFERFYRVDDSRTRSSGGRGLGLAIVRELVELQAGVINLESSLSQGSEFTIMFPSEQKVLRQCLSELYHKGYCESHITKAAENDLGELAEACGIMAKWKSLQANEYNRLLSVIDEV